MNNVPIVKDVCLVGGGHSHALFLRAWAMQPLPGVRLTLVSSDVQTPYSGMLPGLIAGHYSCDDIHIDLLRLCRWADVRFIEDTVTAIDLEARQVKFQQRPGLSFDVLSLDTGSTPDLSVPGSQENVTPVKPVSGFYARWQAVSQNARIGVVGSGAGGFELVTAIQHKLRNTSATCIWFLRGNDSINGRPAQVSKLAIEAATSAGIEVIKGFDVASVEAGKLNAADGRVAELDEIIWCTAATGPTWPASAGLAIDHRGFVATNSYLQSTSHPFVFATGDIGTQVQTPSTKAGVFAVRQAPVLFENIRRYLLREPLKTYKPQADFLTLMATGSQHAIACRGPVVLQGDWVWRWKDHIDQTFMEKFRHLPKRLMNASLARLPNALAEHTSDTAAPSAMLCRGCGAKVGSAVLQRVLDELAAQKTNDAHRVKHSPAEDTAVVDLPTNRLVQSVDHINAIVDDPYLLGRIAALHAISDVITLDATVHSAQVIVTLPEAFDNVIERDLTLLMQGIVEALDAESCALVGGHTTQGSQMSVGVVVNASMATLPATSSPLKPDHTLILTKPLGVGILFAALEQTAARGGDVIKAIESMLLSNTQAANILRKHGCVAITDVTGFGLAGHLNRLLQGMSDNTQSLGATIDLEKIPYLAGAKSLSQAGYQSSLWAQNNTALANAVIENNCTPESVALLSDPQTSGGLLAAVPVHAAADCLEELVASGYASASSIGQLNSSGTVRIMDSKTNLTSGGSAASEDSQMSTPNKQCLLWLRAETKPFERRTLLTPDIAAQLIQDGYSIVVEKSPLRIFDDIEYENAGCEIVDTHAWHQAPQHALILGLKELDPEDGAFTRNHVHFAHVFKEQTGWEQTLTQFQQGGGKLFDLEYLTDETGKRVAAFGYWAGFVGAAVAVLAYCKKCKSGTLGALNAWPDKNALVSEVRAELAKIDDNPTALVIGALGRCGSGAVELLKRCDVKTTAWDQAETASGGPFDAVRDHDLFINCVFINQALPPFTDSAQMERPSRRLQVICDVSCDPFGQYNPVPIYSQCTSMDAPVIEVLPASNNEQSLHLIAIDHLPSLLPRESSEDFSTQLLPILRDIRNLDSGAWKRAGDIFSHHMARLPAETTR